MTDRILPMNDVAYMSPNPIVVTIAKQYHSASPKPPIPGSNAGRIRENAMIRIRIPASISTA